MAYVPVNIDVYTNAYAGTLSGMAVSGWIVGPSPTDYANVTAIAGAYAEAFDTVWNNATTLNWLQIQVIQSVCQEQFRGHAPGSLDNAIFTQPSNWAIAAAACAALVLESDAFVASEGITPNTPGSGAGGVTSFNARVGAVLPQDGDYASSEISNNSNLPGASSSDALNNLNSQLGGTALTDADQALAVTGRYVQIEGSITAIRTKTLTPNALPKYFTVEVGTQAFNEVITNGGPNGGSYTVVAGNKEVVTALSDGTDVVFSAAPLGVEPVV